MAGPHGRMTLPMKAGGGGLPIYNGPGSTYVPGQNEARLSADGAQAALGGYSAASGANQENYRALNKLAGAVDNLVQTGVKAYGNYEAASAQEAFNEYQREEMLLRARLADLQGKNALGENGVIAQIDKWRNEMSGRLEEGMDPIARDLFRKNAANLDAKTYAWAIQKTSHENAEWQNSISLGSIANAQQEALLNPDDLDAYLQAMGVIKAEYEKMGARKGWDEKFVLSKISQAQDQLATERISQMIDNGNLAGARSALRGNVPASFAYSGLGDAVNISETGGEGTASISPGKGDHGGVSYGRSQLASKVGSVKTALEWAKANGFEDIYKELAPLAADARDYNGSFAQKWRQLAREKGGRLEQFDRAYQKNGYYDPLMDRIRKANPELAGRIDKNPALQEQVLSTAVQYGPDSNRYFSAVKEAFAKNPSMDDRELLIAIQDIKARDVARDFTSSSPKVQSGVKNRHSYNEKNLLIAIMDRHGGKLPDDQMGQLENAAVKNNQNSESLTPDISVSAIPQSLPVSGGIISGKNNARLWHKLQAAEDRQNALVSAELAEDIKNGVALCEDGQLDAQFPDEERIRAVFGKRAGPILDDIRTAQDFAFGFNALKTATPEEAQKILESFKPRSQDNFALKNKYYQQMARLVDADFKKRQDDPVAWAIGSDRELNSARVAFMENMTAENWSNYRQSLDVTKTARALPGNELLSHSDAKALAGSLKASPDPLQFVETLQKVTGGDFSNVLNQISPELSNEGRLAIAAASSNRIAARRLLEISRDKDFLKQAKKLIPEWNSEGDAAIDERASEAVAEFNSTLLAGNYYGSKDMAFSVFEGVKKLGAWYALNEGMSLKDGIERAADELVNDRYHYNKANDRRWRVPNSFQLDNDYIASGSQHVLKEISKDMGNYIVTGTHEKLGSQDEYFKSHILNNAYLVTDEQEGGVKVFVGPRLLRYAKDDQSKGVKAGDPVRFNWITLETMGRELAGPRLVDPVDLDDQE